MTAVEPFTFGIPLIPRACAYSWPLLEALLHLTLASVSAQLLEDRKLRHRHERCCDLYREHIAALERRQRSASAVAGS